MAFFSRLPGMIRATAAEIHSIISSILLLRLFYVASQERQVPHVMGMISVERSTPTPSLIVSCLMSLGMLVTSDVYQLINYFSFTLWLWTGIATASLIYLRKTRPEMKRPIAFPLLLPFSFTAGCLVLTVFAVYADPKAAVYGFSFMFVGVPVYFAQKYLSKTTRRNNTTGKSTLHARLHNYTHERQDSLLRK